jgi:hypothetical protein
MVRTKDRWATISHVWLTNQTSSDDLKYFYVNFETKSGFYCSAMKYQGLSKSFKSFGSWWI